ncbi:heterokaryon incompatibility protein-domain-containing protein [Phaeosphaeriaceae sp. PMI808]|nr:heterokaryon incompatibility protein-domain-containing protein [Phaeosphaeriaceae sp. PMI808]
MHHEMSSSVYNYENLLDRSSIRLFRIKRFQPGPTALLDEVEIHLFEASSDDHLEFDAISYAWGQDQLDTTISCNGKSLAVTSNVKRILQKLRNAKSAGVISTGVYWMDSICINQSCIAEKNIQVPKMRFIYGEATLVWIWLGEGCHETKTALLFLVEIACVLDKLVKKEYSNMPFLPQLVEPYDSFKGNVCESRGHYDAIDTNFIVDLINLPWFQRTWVLQELALAKQAVLVCGNVFITWSWFIEALETLQTHELLVSTMHTKSNPASYHNDIECYRTLIDLVRIPTPSPSISTVLRLARPKSSTNPVDKVYGLYGIFDHLKIRGLPEVEYNRPVHTVYTEITTAAITMEKSLVILYQVCLPPLIPGLPSWVPDYSNTAFFRPIKLRESCASGSSSPCFHFNGLQLSIQGLLVDEIKEVATSTSITMANFRRGYNARMDVGDTKRRYNGVIELVRTLQSWIRLGIKVQTYPKHGHSADTFCRILIQNSMFEPGVVNSPGLYDAIEKCMQILVTTFPECPFDIDTFHEEIKSMPEYKSTLDDYAALFGCGTNFDEWPDEIKIRCVLRVYNPKVALIQHEIFLNTYHKTLMLSRAGYLGTCPRWASVGDSVALLSGLQTPFIVRKYGQYHKLVGPAYIDGIMEGEMWDEKQARSITFV